MKDQRLITFDPSFRQVISIWAALFLSVLLFAGIATALTVSGVSRDSSIVVAYITVLILAGCSYAYLKTRKGSSFNLPGKDESSRPMVFISYAHTDETALRERLIARIAEAQSQTQEGVVKYTWLALLTEAANNLGRENESLWKYYFEILDEAEKDQKSQRGSAREGEQVRQHLVSEIRNLIARRAHGQPEDPSERSQETVWGEELKRHWQIIWDNLDELNLGSTPEYQACIRGKYLSLFEKVGGTHRFWGTEERGRRINQVPVSNICYVVLESIERLPKPELRTSLLWYLTGLDPLTVAVVLNVHPTDVPEGYATALRLLQEDKELHAKLQSIVK